MARGELRHNRFSKTQTWNTRVVPQTLQQSPQRRSAPNIKTYKWIPNTQTAPGPRAFIKLSKLERIVQPTLLLFFSFPDSPIKKSL